MLASFSVGDVTRSLSPATGAVNRTVLVEASTGIFVLRCSRRERTRVEWEHAAIAWAADRGAPVCRPIPLPSGETIAERSGTFYALFPFAPGRQIPRADLQPSHARMAGACLARLHDVFASFPMDLAPRKKLGVDIGAALAVIPQIERAIHERSVKTDLERSALAQLSGRRRWFQALEGGDGEDIQEPMAALPQSILHGDYQETNLFFGADAVVAVIDWDQCGAGARSYDVLRALHLMLALSPALCRAFLEGYRSVRDLPDEELDAMARCYGALSDSNLWVFAAAYLENNERAKPFIGIGPFVPFCEKWERVWGECKNRG